MAGELVPSSQLCSSYRQLPACLCAVGSSHIGPSGDPESFAWQLLGVELGRVGREEKQDQEDCPSKSIAKQKP